MLDFQRLAGSANILLAMVEFQAVMDAVRDVGAHSVV